MAEQERKLEHGLQVMLDLLTNYFGNAATRTEWLTETQKRFTNRKKLRRGWSDDSIDRKIKKLEQMGLITGGRGWGQYYSAAATAKPESNPHTNNPLLGFAHSSDVPDTASVRKSPAHESFLDALKAAKLQLLK
jgi:hypothetical protein